MEKNSTSMANSIKKLPGVLSFQRGMLATDALFFNVFDDGRVSPLQVVRHGIRGTQNIYKVGAGDSAGSTAASMKRENVSNIQTTDSAKLDPDAVALQVNFDLRFLGLECLLFACAPGQKDSVDDVHAIRGALSAFIAKAKLSEGIKEIACRYTRNIANGRFLWRNRAVAQSVTVVVSDGTKEIASFNALKIPLNEFANYSDEEHRVADVIAAGLRGDRLAQLRIKAIVDFGVRGPVEVFPSQNYLEKERGFARPLYCVGDAPPAQRAHTIQEMGQAALRDQKVGNALRTFDTWYPAFAERRLPIPIEPNGASLDAQEFFRNTADTSGFRLMLRVGDLDPNTNEGMFVLACIIRGGVFSGSDS